MNAAAALYRLSRLASGEQNLQSFVEDAAGILAAEGAAETSITLTNPATGEVAQAVSARDASNTTASFAIARDVVVRGVRYGRFELKLSSGSAVALLAADAAASQLARFAEREAIRTRNSQLSQHIEASVAELAARKLLARATGLFRGRLAQRAA